MISPNQLDPDAWERWKHLVIDGIERVEKDIKEVKRELVAMSIELAILKTETSQKATARGAVAGLFTSLATLVVAVAIAVAAGRLK